MLEELKSKVPQDPHVAVPFGVNFEVNANVSEQTANTNTHGMGDDDTGTFRRDTEDYDT